MKSEKLVNIVVILVPVLWLIDSGLRWMAKSDFSLVPVERWFGLIILAVIVTAAVGIPKMAVKPFSEFWQTSFARLAGWKKAFLIAAGFGSWLLNVYISRLP